MPSTLRADTMEGPGEVTHGIADRRMDAGLDVGRLVLADVGDASGTMLQLVFGLVASPCAGVLAGGGLSSPLTRLGGADFAEMVAASPDVPLVVGPQRDINHG